MKKSKTQTVRKFFLFSYFLLLTSFLSSCIRLTGGAGVWKQGADDAAPTTHQVGFDTQQMVPQQNQANITT